MRVRNNTGIIHVFQGVKYLPNVWVDVPVEVAQRMFARQIVDIELPQDLREYRWIDPDQKINLLWQSPLVMADGYGAAAVNMILALDRAGVNIQPQICAYHEPKGLPERVAELLKGGVRQPMRVGLCMSTPCDFLSMPTPYRIGLTMYESTDPIKARPEWIPGLLGVDMLLVPTEFSREVFSQYFAGRIEVTPLAVDTRYYVGPQNKRVAKDTFKFVMHGTLTGRKSPLETLECWQKAFPIRKYPDVRLEFKTRIGVLGKNWGELPKLDDKRITVISEEWPVEKMRDWLLGADCFLFISKGEGFGVPPREAIATGCPTILSNNTGHIPICDKRYVWPIRTHHKEKTPLGGDWFIPDWDEAIETMRSVYEHREASYEKAWKASSWFIEKWGADAAAQRLISVLRTVDPQAAQIADRPRVLTMAPSLETVHQHRAFFEHIDSTVTAGSRVLDIGVGDGLLYEYMSNQGYEVWGACSEEYIPGVQNRLKMRGLSIIRLLKLDPEKPQSFVAAARRMPRFDLAVSQGVFQQLSWEIVTILLDLMIKYADRVIFTVPSHNYPGQFMPNAALWSKEAWMDKLVDYVADVSYYGEGDRYIKVEVRGRSKARVGTVTKRGK